MATGQSHTRGPAMDRGRTQRGTTPGTPSLPRAEPSRLSLQVTRGWQGPLLKVRTHYKEAGQREEVFWSGSRRTEVDSGRQVGRARERAGVEGENGGGGLLLRDSGRTQRLAGREGPEEAGEREGCGGGDRGARVDGGGQGGQGSLQKGDVGNSGAPPSSAGAGDRGRGWSWTTAEAVGGAWGAGPSWSAVLVLKGLCILGLGSLEKISTQRGRRSRCHGAVV